MEEWTEEDWKKVVDQRREQVIEQLEQVDSVWILDLVSAFLHGMTGK